MESKGAKIVLNSQVNLNTYYLYNDKVIVDKNNGDCKRICLPHEEYAICFYDMYYASDGLRIIIATRNDYDKAYILDENTSTILY